MESIGLFTPPDQRMSMSPSTFWRRPDEKKLEGAAIDWAATAASWRSGAHGVRDLLPLSCDLLVRRTPA